MAEQYTNTPWYCEGDAIYDNPECTGNPIAHVLSCAYGADDNAVDARRIVACVNACEGSETIALEQLANSGGLSRIFSERAEYSAMAGKLEAERDQLRQVCAEAYQFAGAYDAPVEVLDNLSAAANGWPLPHDSFLPVMDSGVAVERDQLKQQNDQLLAALEEAKEVLDTAKGNINPERGYADELEADIERAYGVALAAIAAVKGEYIQQAGRATRKVGVTFITPPGMSADELKASILRMKGEAQ